MEFSHIKSSTVSLNHSIVEKKTSENENNAYGLLTKNIKSQSMNDMKVQNSLLLYEDEHYGNNALWLFHNDNPFRQKVQQVVTHKYFTYSINILIIINSIFLIFETIDSLQDVSKYSNIVFTVLFTIEFCLKTIAYGFILEPYSYLRDPWNWLDFLVVITSLLTLIPEINANLMALRTFRLIRPLQSITILPTLRVFISTLISSMVDLSIIYLMMFFFLIIFAIIGVSLWSDRFHYRCRTVTAPINMTLPIDPKFANVLCGGSIKCETIDHCLNTLDYYPQYILKEVIEEEKNNAALNWGLTAFEDILESLFVVFLTTTNEGWPKIMEMYMDGYNYVVSFIYFILCVVINYYFMFNLSVATLLYNFETAKRVDTWVFLRKSKTKNKMENASTINAIGARNSKETNERNMYRLKYIPLKNIKRQEKWTKANICSGFKINQCFEIILPQSEYHLKFKFGFYCYYFYNQPFIQYFFYLCIFTNTILLALDRADISHKEAYVLECFNIMFVAVFAFEIIVIIFSVGLYKFFRDLWYIYDFIIVSVSLGEIIIRRATNSSSTSSIISLFRMLRIFRVFKLFRKWSNFQVIMSSLTQTLIRMIDYLFVFLLFVYMYTLLGYSFLHGAMTNQDFNFDSFINSFICILRIIIGDHWEDIFYECVKATGFNNVATYIFFITLIFFGQLTLVNIFMSYLFDNFQRAKNHFERNVIVKNYINDIIIFLTKEHQMESFTPSGTNKQSNSDKKNHVKSLNKYLQKIQNKKVISEGEFILMNKLRMDFTFFKTIGSEAFSYLLNENETLNSYQMKVIFFEKKYKRDQVIMQESNNLYFEDDFFTFPNNHYKPPKKSTKIMMSRKSIVNEIKEIINEDETGNNDWRNTIRRQNSSPQMMLASNEIKKHNNTSKLYLNRLSSTNILNYKDIDNELEVLESIESLRPLKKDEQCEFTLSSITPSRLNNNDVTIDKEDFDIKSSKRNITNEDKESHSSQLKRKEVLKYKKSLTNSIIPKSLNRNSYLLKHKSAASLVGLTIKKRSSVKKLSLISETKPNESLILEDVNKIGRSRTVKTKMEIFKEKITPIINYMKNSSLFIFHKDWKIRKMIEKLVNHPYFNYTIFGLIICNCIIMCFDNPWLDDNSKTKLAIFWLNRVFNIFFIIEGFLKVVSLNFIFKEKKEMSNLLSLKKAIRRKQKQKANIQSDTESLSISINSSNMNWNKMNLVEKEEILAKAEQMSNKQKPYLLDPINVIDFICIILSIVDMSIVNNLSYLRVLRVFRAIKPIRLFMKNENMTIMLSCLLKSVPGLTHVMILCLIFIYTFGVLGVSFFHQNLYYYCTNIKLRTKEDCLKENEHWYVNSNNFSNFGFSLKTNLIIMLSDNWGHMMALAGHKLGHRWVYWYYVIYVVIGYFIIWNLFASVIIQNFKFLKGKEKQYKTLTPPEKEWIHLQKVILKRIPRVKPEIKTSNRFQFVFHKFLQSKAFNNSVLVSISLCIFILIIQYNSSSKVYKTTLDIFSYILSFIFNVEIALKIYIWKKQFFYSYWNLIDLFLMIACDIIIILNILTYANVCDIHSISILPITLRALRLLRGLRELHAFRSFHSLIDTLMYLPMAIANVGIILFLLILIYGNIGMNVFGTLPLRKVINSHINFRDFISTSLLLFQIATKNSINEFLDEISYNNCTNPSSVEYQENYYCFHYNITCYDSDLVNYTSMTELGMFTCGTDFSYFYIISFVLIGPLFIMNLCIVMVIEGFSESMKDNEGILTTDYMKNFLSIWIKYDPECKRLIKPYEFALMIKELQPAFGINYDGSYESMYLLSQRDRNKYEAYRRVIQLIESKASEFKIIAEGGEQGDDNVSDEMKIVKKEKNAYSFDNSFYLSHNLTNYTNEKEIMMLCHKFNISPIEINEETGEITNQISDNPMNESNVLSKDYYIHYIDACLALSRFAICKMMQVESDNLRLDVVGSYTKKLWIRGFKDDKVIISSFFQPKNYIKKLSSILATRMLYNKLLKKQIEFARQRLVDKKKEQEKQEEDEIQRKIYEEIGSILNLDELEINIQEDKEPMIIEEKERNIDQMYKNDVTRNSKRNRSHVIETQNLFFKIKQMSHETFNIHNRFKKVKNEVQNKVINEVIDSDEFYCENEFNSSK